MAVFKPTNQVQKTTKAFKPTKYAGYSNSTVYGWQSQNKSALDILNEYQSKISKGEWLSEEDRARYSSAIDTYTSTGNSLRDVSKFYGAKYTDDEEKSWQDSLSSLKQGYTSANDFYNQFSDESQYREWNNWVKPIEDDDYAKYIQLGKTVSNPSWEDSQPKFEIFGWAPFGDGQSINNMVTFAENNASKAFADAGQELRAGAGSSDYTYLVNLINMFMTDEEKARYNYYIGKGDNAKAQEYLSYMENVLTQRQGGEISRQVDQTLLEPFFSFATGMQNGIYGIENFVRGVGGSEGVPTSALQYANFYNNQNNTGVGKVVNDLANTTGNMFPSLVVGTINPTAGAVTMGLSAGGNAYADMLNQGYSVNQARAYGVMIGASEAALSKVLGGISSLGGNGNGVFQSISSKVLPGVNNAIARTAIQLGGNVLDEAFEEGVQTALESVFKWAATLGETEFEKINWEEVGYSALLGGLSAGLLEGAPSVYKGVSINQAAQKAYGNQAPDVVAQALELNSNDKLAQMAQSRLNKGKNVSGLVLNDLAQNIEQGYTKQDSTKIKSAVETRLQDLGENGDVSSLANAIAKQIAGEKLNFGESKLIKNSQYAQRVLNELNPQNIEQGTHTSAWAEGIGTKRVNADAYNRRASVQVKTNDGKNTTIGEVKSIDGDVATVELEDGTIAKVGLDKNANTDLKFDNPKMESVFKIATEKVGRVEGWTIETANAMIKAYESNNTLGVEAFARGWSEAYNIGRNNNSVAQLNHSSYATLLDESTRSNAYNIGKALAMPSKNVATEQEYKVSFDSTVDETKLTNKQKDQIKALDIVSKALGVNVKVFDSPVNAKGERIGKNGSYNPTTRTIEVDLHAGTDGKGVMLFTASHELTHHMKEVARDKFNSYADAVFEALGEDADALVENKLESLRRNGHLEGKTEEEAYDLAFEEIVADSAERMLVDTDALARLSESLKGKDKTLWEKVKDFFTSLIEKIKKAYEELSPDSIEAQRLSEIGDELEKIQKIWVEGIVEASKTGDTVSTDAETTHTQAKDVKYSDRDSIYLDAVNRGDMETAQKMVDEAAKKAGYDSPMLYHGTPTSFGFTVFDASKVDDKLSFFATSDKNVAKTYSGETDQQYIYERITDDVDNAPPEKLLEFLQKYVDNNYKRISKEELEELKAPLYETIKSSATKAREFLEENQYAFNEEKRRLVYRIANSISAMAEIGVDEEFDDDRLDDLRARYQDAVWELRAMDSSISYELFDAIDTKDLFRAVENLRDYSMSKAIFTNGIKTINDNSAWTILSSTLYRGIYSLYANPESLLEINANGANWNRISTTSIQNIKHYVTVENEFNNGTLDSMMSYKEAYSTAEKLAKEKFGKETKIDTQEIKDYQDGRHTVVFRAVVDGMIGDKILVLKQGVSNYTNTRGLAKYAKDAGYNGVKITNLKDSGGAISYTAPSDVYIFFNSSQMKSADPVTYDDDGNVIPLSERFKAENNDIRYSFRNSSSGMANDGLSPYNAELTKFIEQNNGYIVDSFDKLKKVVNLAFDNPNAKGTAYFGIINTDVLEKIKNSIPNLPQATRDVLFKKGKDYSIATTLDSIRHIVDEKKLSRTDVIDYLDRLADTIVEFDTVTFDYYHQGASKTAGLLFKKQFNDGTLVSFDLVSHKKRSLLLQTLYLNSADYKKKKAAETLLMPKASAYTSKTQVGQPSTNSISQKSDLSTKNLKNSDRTYVQEGNRAVMTQERLDYLIEDSGAGKRKDYANKWLAKISPKAYLDLTTEGHSREEFDKMGSEWNAKVNMSNYDYLGQLGKSLRQTPYLAIEIDTGKVVGHDGRHRIRALEMNGIESVEIYVEFRDAEGTTIKYQPNGERWESQSGIVLTNQFGTGLTAEAFDLIPLNEDHRAEIELVYGENANPDATIKYQDRASPEESFSNRSLLANALESAIQSDVEYKKLDDYKAVLGYLKAEEIKLAELQRQIYDMTFGNGERDAKKLKELQEEKRKTESRIDFHDKKLLQLEATKALTNVLERAKKQAYQSAMEKGRELMHRNVEGRHKTIEREKIKKVAKELDKLLSRGNKKKNVKVGAQGIVRAALDLSNMYFATDDEIVTSGIITEATESENLALAKYRKLYEEYHSFDNDVTNHKDERANLRKEMSEVKKDFAELLERERQRISKLKAKESMNTLANAYAELKNADEDYLNGAYRQEVAERLSSLAEDLGDTLVADMTLEQLEALYKAFSMIKHLVQTSNQMFRDGKKEEMSVRVNAIFSEINKLKNASDKDYIEWYGKARNAFDKFRWNNLRPVDAFEVIGSTHLEDLYWDVIKAQDVYANDIEEAKSAIINARKTHGYQKWDMDITNTFKSIDGREFKLTLGEMMSLYAYSKRTQADKHLREGGFQYEKEATYKDKRGVRRLHKNEAYTYKVSDDLMISIINSLTKEQKAYAEEVQKLLTSWGEKGNEASRILYGIDLFNEEVYFPLRSSKDYLSSVDTEMGKTMTTASLSNSGFTKATTPKANNPIILRAFDDVVLEHLDKMSKYHAYVVPIDNLRKVLDAKATDSLDNQLALKSLIRSKHGDGAESYLQTFITDLNGGAMSQPAPLEEWIGKAKAVQVMANLSVWVQQYFSVIRATSEVDAKYFIPFLGESYRKEDMKLYNEMKRYAPITVIKEMGGFDVGSNRGAKEYFGYEETKRTTSKTEKQVQDALGVGATMMDKLGWMTIWKAVKKEVAATNKYKPNSEEYYKACGERFERVIAKTQVYDSVNARSGHMRSKNVLTKMMTSFMGEPTVIVGMAYSSIVNYTRAVNLGDKAQIKKATARLTSTAISLTLATAMTSVAKSLIYAMRDDDEDETFLEKYASALGGAFRDDLNLLNYAPVFRDISSVINGFTIERPDMSLLEDLIFTVKKIADEEDDKVDEWINFAGAAANLLRFPLKNIIRDIKALSNTITGLGKDFDTDFGAEFYEGLSNKERTKSENLYNAVIRGDTKRLEYYQSTYKEASGYESALRKALRDNDPRVEEGAKARLNGDNDTYYRLMMDIIDEGNFDRQLVIDAFKAEYNYLKDKLESKKE